MDRTEVERFLAASLADRKLSGGEKQAFSEWLAENAKTEHQKGVIRHAVFDLAQGEVADPEAARIISWLEDAIKCIVPIQSRSSTPDMSPDSVYFSPGEACMQRIIHRFHLVKEAAEICTFTITDDRISRAILDAHRRGVKLRIISDEAKADDLGSDLKQFQDAGIPVKLIRATCSDSRKDGHMHHKFAIFDRLRMINGSYNWTRGAANVNYENLVDTADAGMLKRFTEEFERLWTA